VWRAGAIGLRLGGSWVLTFAWCVIDCVLWRGWTLFVGGSGGLSGSGKA